MLRMTYLIGKIEVYEEWMKHFTVDKFSTVRESIQKEINKLENEFMKLFFDELVAMYNSNYKFAYIDTLEYQENPIIKVQFNDVNITISNLHKNKINFFIECNNELDNYNKISAFSTSFMIFQEIMNNIINK